MKWYTKGAAGVALAFAFVGAYTVTSIILDRDPPVVFDEGVALTPDVQQGGVLEVRFIGTRKRICPTAGSRVITDSDGAQHIPSSFTVGEWQFSKGREIYTGTITIPFAASVGKARFDLKFIYACNALHKLFPIEVPSPPVYFNITEAPVAIEPLTPPELGNDGKKP